MAALAKENLPGGSLKYLFVYLKVCIFILKCSYRLHIYFILLTRRKSWQQFVGPPCNANFAKRESSQQATALILSDRDFQKGK